MDICKEVFSAKECLAEAQLQQKCGLAAGPQSPDCEILL